MGTSPGGPSTIETRDFGGPERFRAPQFHLKQGVHKVVLPKSIPAQIRQLILCISSHKGQVDRFVRDLTFATRLHKHFL